VAVFVSKRLAPSPAPEGANVARPVDGPTVTTPTVNRSATLQGFRGRPVALLFGAPYYAGGLGGDTKAYIANGNARPRYVNDLSDATFDFSDPIRLRFRSTPWARYVWVGIQYVAQSYTENSNKKPVMAVSLATPLVNGLGGVTFDTGCLIEPIGSSTDQLLFASTGVVQYDTTGQTGTPRLLNLNPSADPGAGVDTDVEVVIDLASVANPTGVRVFSVSAWELWEAVVS
jgi:hypothetical protein